MAIDERQQQVLFRRTQRDQARGDWRRHFQGSALIWNLLKLGTLLLVVAVVAGVWVVSNAHLGEQTAGRAAPGAAGLIDPNGESVLTLAGQHRAAGFWPSACACARTN
jgi:predicted amidohydrolase